jgi:hypothetical protein
MKHAQLVSMVFPSNASLLIEVSVSNPFPMGVGNVLKLKSKVSETQTIGAWA